MICPCHDLAYLTLLILLRPPKSLGAPCLGVPVGSSAAAMFFDYFDFDYGFYSHGARHTIQRGYIV